MELDDGVTCGLRSLVVPTLEPQIAAFVSSLGLKRAFQSCGTILPIGFSEIGSACGLCAALLGDSLLVSDGDLENNGRPMGYRGLSATLGLRFGGAGRTGDGVSGNGFRNNSTRIRLRLGNVDRTASTVGIVSGRPSTESTCRTFRIRALSAF